MKISGRLRDVTECGYGVLPQFQTEGKKSNDLCKSNVESHAQNNSLDIH